MQWVRDVRRIDALLLAGVGVLLVHQFSYTASSLIGVKTAVTHGHLEIAWLIGSLTTIGALARAVTRSLRRRHHEPGTVLSFTKTILIGYLGLEAIERVANGLNVMSLLGESVFWLGLLIAPFVAWILRWSLRTVERFVATSLDSSTDLEFTSRSATSLGVTSVVLLPQIFFSFMVSRRGPPQLLSA